MRGKFLDTIVDNDVIDMRLHMSMAFVDYTRTLWEDIGKRYVVANIPKIRKLKAEIASYRQNKQEVMEVFLKLTGLWNELDNYVKIPPCRL